MKRLLKIPLLFTSAILIVLSILFLIIKDPDPSFMKDLSRVNEPILLEKITTSFDKIGSFKSKITLIKTLSNNQNNFIYQIFDIKNNKSLDKINVGINSENKLVIELLKDDKVIQSASSKISHSIPQNTPISLFVSYHSDQPDIIKPSEKTLEVKLCEGNGFFGDIANLEIDMKEMEIHFEDAELIALNDGKNSAYKLEEISFWKDYESFD